MINITKISSIKPLKIQFKYSTFSKTAIALPVIISTSPSDNNLSFVFSFFCMLTILPKVMINHMIGSDRPAKIPSIGTAVDNSKFFKFNSLIIGNFIVVFLFSFFSCLINSSSEMFSDGS